MITIALALHLPPPLFARMFFAIMALRLAAGELDPPIRVLVGPCFPKFFPWVWMAVIILPLSGYRMIFSVWGGFAGLPLHVHIMQAFGLVMILIYLHLWFAPYRRFRIALSNSDIPEAGKNLNQIRILVTVNLIIGLVTSVVGSTGRYW